MKLRSVLLWLLPILSVAQTQAVTPTLALTHVTVIDATGAPVNRDMTVIISGGRIRELGNSAKLHPPREAQIDPTPPSAPPSRSCFSCFPCSPFHGGRARRPPLRRRRARGAGPRKLRSEYVRRRRR